MKITSPQRAFRFFENRLSPDVEEFWVAALNAQKTVTAAACVFRGTADYCLFHPRDVFRFAYQNNACAIVVAHNHPSGDPRPSPADIQVTARLLDAAVILQVPLVDHLILAGSKYYSFLEQGKLGR